MKDDWIETDQRNISFHWFEGEKYVQEEENLGQHL